MVVVAVIFGFVKKIYRKITGQRSIKALIILPSKTVLMNDVYTSGRQFDLEIEGQKKLYTLDERAIYFYKNQPFLFYHHGCSSPLMFSDIGELSYSLSSDEMSALAESKAIQELLTAALGDDKKGLLFWVTLASAVASIVTMLVVTGVVKIGPQG